MSTVDLARLMGVRPAGDATGATTAVRPVGEVFLALAPAVHGYLRAAGVSDSENVLGEVFLRVARALPRFTGSDADLRRWVFTIAHNCVVDDRRRATRERASLAFLHRRDRRAAAPAPAEPLDPGLLAALQDLTAEQREVVTLRFVADLSLDEVARMTGRDVGAVKSLQHRALRTLSAALSDW